MSAVGVSFSLDANSRMFLLNERMLLTVLEARPLDFAPPTVKGSRLHLIKSEREILETGLSPKVGNKYKASRFVYLTMLDVLS